MEDRIRVTLEQGVADVRLVRGDKMNALDDAMFDALRRTGEQMKSTAGLRAVVLSGEGRAFCAGLDTATKLPNITIGSFGAAAFIARTAGAETATTRSKSAPASSCASAGRRLKSPPAQRTSIVKLRPSA